MSKRNYIHHSYCCPTSTSTSIPGRQRNPPRLNTLPILLRPHAIFPWSQNAFRIDAIHDHLVQPYIDIIVEAVRPRNLILDGEMRATLSPTELVCVSSIVDEAGDTYHPFAAPLSIISFIHKCIKCIFRVLSGSSRSNTRSTIWCISLIPIIKSATMSNPYDFERRFTSS